MKTVAVIQARLSSSRLPRKVLLPLLGRPILWWVVERTRRASGVDVMVATSDDPSDDELAGWCAKEGIACFRGPLNDVLARYQGAAEASQADVVVRVTSDCPFVDPLVVQSVVNRLVTAQLDYAGNTRQRSYPHGADVEAMTAAALEAAYMEAKEPFEREHVTPFIWSRPDRFRQVQVLAPSEFNRPGLRITVDTHEDYMLVQALYEELGDGFATLSDVLALIDRKPWLALINSAVRQKPVFANPDPRTRLLQEIVEGARISLSQDMFNASISLSTLAIQVAGGADTELGSRTKAEAQEAFDRASAALRQRTEL